MKKQLFFLGAALATAAVAFAGTAGSSQRAAPAGKTIIVTWKQSDYKRTDFVDWPPKSPTHNPDHITPGDVILSTLVVRNAAGTPIGTAYSELRFLTPSVNQTSIDLVHGVYVFSDGEITSTAVHGPHISGADPITGGSGAYAGARGTITDISPGNAKVSKAAIRLLP